jgi:hypothetical protein
MQSIGAVKMVGKGAQYAAFADKAGTDLNGAKTDTLEPWSRIAAARSMQTHGAHAEGTRKSTPSVEHWTDLDRASRARAEINAY